MSQQMSFSIVLTSCLPPHQSNHPLTQSSTYSLALTHSPTCPPTHSLTDLPAYPPTHSPICSPTHSLTHSPTCLPTHPLSHQPIRIPLPSSQSTLTHCGPSRTSIRPCICNCINVRASIHESIIHLSILGGEKSCESNCSSS